MTTDLEPPCQIERLERLYEEAQAVEGTAFKRLAERPNDPDLLNVWTNATRVVAGVWEDLRIARKTKTDEDH